MTSQYSKQSQSQKVSRSIGTEDILRIQHINNSLSLLGDMFSCVKEEYNASSQQLESIFNVLTDYTNPLLEVEETFGKG
ncbi:hypothetical protein HPDP_00073 [Candidatus Hepatincola sp. Pdp]